MSDWHAMSPSEAAEALSADVERGLSADEAKKRLTADGPNRLTARPGRPAWRRLLDQFVQPLIVILIVAAGVSAALGDLVDALVIGAVVIINALIGFIQEHRAHQAIAALDELVPSDATVIRDGRERRIDSASLVRGDLVVLASGDSVPADVRLVKVRDLQVDEAALTGESLPVAKQVDVLEASTVLADRVNLAFAGTAVTFGRGRGVVIATGDATETGRIATMIAGATEIVTPLTRRIASLSKMLVWIILAISGGLFAFETVRGAELTRTFNAAVALAVGAIPEGLPAAVTVLLAVGVSQMARRRALIRRLPAVETLGSTTVICSDKTGTLTQNEMTVTRVATLGDEYGVTGVGYTPEGHFERDGAQIEPLERPALLACLRVGALCNDTRVVEEEGTITVEGDPTEAALSVAADKAQLESALSGWSRLDAIPFESERMFMATLDENPEGERWVSVKGSSEALFERCTLAMAEDGSDAPFEREILEARVESLAAEGLRVLALAQRRHEGESLELEDVAELTFLGLVGMIDPPRDAARPAIEACHRAGVLVKMITGDHAVTASAIAAQIGLEGARDDAGRLRAITGVELDAIHDDDLGEIVESVSVFARVAPEQKLRLVRALQARGHIVAMTGDGVNDAPALEQADIGVAMGKGGTDVARGASAMILTDDDFATIAAAVEEGRGVYDNLMKFVTWTLPTNGGEALVLLAAVVTGAALPILPVQILWVNMATAVFLGIALVFEPKEPGLMDRPPRDANAPLLSPMLGVRTLLVSCLIAAAAFGLFEWTLSEDPTATDKARTIAVNTIVVIEVAYLFACRSLRLPIWKLGLFTNRWVWIGATVMLLAQLLFTYAPFMQALFHTAPLEWIWWVYFTAAGAVVFVVVEAKKLIGRKVA